MKNCRVTNVTNILKILGICVFAISIFSCKADSQDTLANAQYVPVSNLEESRIVPGAERMSRYLPLIHNKKVGLTVNHSSRIGDAHLVDSLLKLDVNITRIFAPEHGFRGTADAGAHLEDQRDPDTGLEVVSLYGSKRKPQPGDLNGIEVMIFDIQDVGVRFYTFISTLHLVMQACAEQNIPVIVLDRPNPNGYYVDGPMLEIGYQSFVGMHPIPVAYGLTIGEMASMIAGEGWLGSGLKSNLTVVPCSNYDHTMTYELPVAPSPNLPNLRSVLLYPSLCFFEPTTVSIGRGTDKQFQVIGHPSAELGDFVFTPEPKPGASKPKHEGVELAGQDLSSLSIQDIRQWKGLNLDWLVQAYHKSGEEAAFITSPGFFDKLAGSNKLRKQLLAGKTSEEIKASWQPELLTYLRVRNKYLLYRDFD